MGTRFSSAFVKGGAHSQRGSRCLSIYRKKSYRLGQQCSHLCFSLLAPFVAAMTGSRRWLSTFSIKSRLRKLLVHRGGIVTTDWRTFSISRSARLQTDSSYGSVTISSKLDLSQMCPGVSSSGLAARVIPTRIQDRNRMPWTLDGRLESSPPLRR